MPVELVWRVLLDALAVVVEAVREVEVAVGVPEDLVRTSAAEAVLVREGLLGQADTQATTGLLAQVAEVAVLGRPVKFNTEFAIPMAMKKKHL